MVPLVQLLETEEIMDRKGSRYVCKEKQEGCFHKCQDCQVALEIKRHLRNLRLQSSLNVDLDNHSPFS